MSKVVFKGLPTKPGCFTPDCLRFYAEALFCALLQGKEKRIPVPVPPFSIKAIQWGRNGRYEWICLFRCRSIYIYIRTGEGGGAPESGRKKEIKKAPSGRKRYENLFFQFCALAFALLRPTAFRTTARRVGAAD